MGRVKVQGHSLSLHHQLSELAEGRIETGLRDALRWRRSLRLLPQEKHLSQQIRNDVRGTESSYREESFEWISCGAEISLQLRNRRCAHIRERPLLGGAYD